MPLVGRSKISARLDEVERKIRQIKDRAHEKFQEVTPIRTGNAKSKTRRIADGVEADYPYANRLNEGYSRQAPKGMTEPTVEDIQDYVRRI
jgi:hypothetical protein